MIRRNGELVRGNVEHFKDGKGTLTLTDVLLPEEMGGHGRKYCFTVLPPGSSIGTHVHSGDSETYYILSGTGLYNDNGTMVTVSAGDMTHCPDGECHGLENTGTEPLELMALILYTGMKD